MRVVLDIEASGLLNEDSIDYTQSPYKLRDTFKIWCIVVKDIDTKEIFVFKENEVKTKFVELYKKVTTVIQHNGINYDLLALKLYTGISYTVEPDTINGKEVEIIDTMVVSKTLNPDRFGGHSLDSWGKRFKNSKIDYRGKLIELGVMTGKEPKGFEFSFYHPEMINYCIQDVNLTEQVYFELEKEKGNWPWEDAIKLEKAVAEIITRQEHRGFAFDSNLAVACVKDLDEKIKKIVDVVEPILPPKPLSKTAAKGFTPPATQFLKSGEPSSHIRKFVEKHDGQLDEENKLVTIFGKTYKLPIEVEPLIKEEPATLKDTTLIKEWLVRDYGWNPTQYKERDLTVNQKKVKLNAVAYVKVVEKYVEQTLNSAFCNDRLEHIGATRSNLKRKLLDKDTNKPVKVLTNPTFTIGQDKEICPNLAKLSEKFPYTQQIIEFLTYNHRRNSILGGGFDPEEDEDEPEKGFLANVRVDGRIPTPADTCGAGTSRFKHRICCNIPRATSLYGEQMRSLFGAGDDYYQIGYDFDSLEAKIESHYTYKYEGGPEYGESLTAEKPNDCHTVLAKYISGLLGRDFPRGTAKSVKYGCFPIDITQVLTPSGWKNFNEISIGSSVLSMDTETNVVRVDKVSQTWFYPNANVSTFGNSRWNMECTEDHRWFGRTKFMNVSDGDSKFYTASDFKTNYSIQTAGEYVGGNSEVTPNEAALVAWLLSDGHYKWSKKSKMKTQGVFGSIAQASHKFQKQVKLILEANNMTWKETNLGSDNENVNISYRLKATELRQFLDKVVGSREDKHSVDWVSWVLRLSVEAMESFLYNFWLADGSTTVESSTVIKQNRGNIADAVMVVGSMLGYKVTQTGGKCSVINLKKDCHVGLQTAKLTPKRTADVACITTSKGTFIIKQQGRISVTGNCSYNAQPKRVTKIVGCDIDTANVIFNAFWEKASPLKELKENMQKYWETTGEKKFLLGLDKRKLPIRSKGNVINTAFQSAGVICAKRAMVLHDRKLKQHNLVVDFFAEDWKQRTFAQQMIAYHDEAQTEVSKSLVKFKMFKTEQEAKEFHKANPEWGEVAHTDKGYYCAYSLPGVLAVQSVKEAGQYYNLNVELTAGYIVHKNWFGCH